MARATGVIMNGKIKCEVLKNIRREIARANGIRLDIPECTHKGDCPGTCPRCESEVRYLERAIEERRRRGLKVAIAGVSAGLVALNTASCDGLDILTGGNTAGDMQVLDGDIAAVTDISDETGSICTETTESGEELVSITSPGSIAVAPESLEGEFEETEMYVLEGDIAFVEDTQIAGGIGPAPDDFIFDDTTDHTGGTADASEEAEAE